MGHRPLLTEARKADIVFLNLGGGETEIFLGREKKKKKDIDVLMLERMEKKKSNYFFEGL